MNRILAIVLCLFCVAAVTPPLPTKPKVQSPKSAEQARTLLKVPSAEPLAGVPVVRVLVWDWKVDPSNPASNVVFVVRSNPKLTTSPLKWTVAAVTKTNGYSITCSQPMGLFCVSASNTVTKLSKP